MIAPFTSADLARKRFQAAFSSLCYLGKLPSALSINCCIRNDLAIHVNDTEASAFLLPADSSACAVISARRHRQPADGAVCTSNSPRSFNQLGGQIRLISLEWPLPLCWSKEN